MASLFKSGASKRKAEAPGKIRIQLKAKTSNKDHDDIEMCDETDDENNEDDLPISFGNGIQEDVVEPEPTEDAQLKKKRDVPARIDTSILDNVSCTACGHQLNPYKNGALQKHPQLKVVICKNCEKFLNSGEISKDSDGADEQCRWCGEGGRLLVCDDCSGAFCKSCVMRNFSRSEFNNINSQDNWHCFLCNKAPLAGLRENYRKIKDTLKALQAKEKAKAAACPNTSITQLPKQTPGTKEKGTISNSATAGGQVVSSQNKFAGPTLVVAQSSLLSLEDLNVKPENVAVTTEKLLTATNTLREVLQALQSPSQFSAASGLQRQQQQARALNKSLETYLRSFKAILTESTLTRVMSIQIDKLPITLKDKESVSVKQTVSSDKFSSNSASTPKGPGSKLSTKTVYIDDCVKSVCEIAASVVTTNDASCDNGPKVDTVPVSNSRKGVKKINGDLSSKVSSRSKSKQSSTESSNDSDSDASTPAKDKRRASITNNTRTSSTSKGSEANSTKDSDDNSKDKAIESPGNTNNKKSKAESEDKNSEKSDTSNAKKNEKDSQVKSINDQPDDDDQAASGEEAVEEATGKSSLKETNSGSCQEQPQDGDEPTGDLSDQTEKDKSVSKNIHNHDVENLAAKLDLIKELADEMIRDHSEEENDEDDLPISFGQATDELEDSKKEARPRKNSEVSSNDDSEKKSNDDSEKKSKSPVVSDKKKSSNDDSEKKSKSSVVSDNKKLSKKLPGASSKQTVAKGKKKEDPADVGASSDASSTGLLISGEEEDDDDLTAKRKTKKNTDKEKPAGKTSKGSKSHQTAGKGKGKVQNKKMLNVSSSSEDEDIDKEIEKLSKMPTMRKRKAAEMSEDEGETKEEEPAISKVDKTDVKRPKPGPKSSKKGIDYDDLSSDEEENKDDVDEDDDELPVTFCEDNAGLKVMAVDENELAKNLLLEDIESDVEEDEEDSSIDDLSDGDEKPKKQKQKKDKEVKKEVKHEDDDDDDDSDENIGKRKKIHNKLLDAKLSSDSDSDVVKSKKPKKDSDNDSFKAEKSSGSSSSSDFSEDDDDDDSSNSESDDDYDQPKKKGKKKASKKSKKKKGRKRSDDDEDDDDSDVGKKKKRKGRKRSDDDEDDDDSDVGKKKKKGKEKKRRRIKKVNSSSDDLEDKSDGGDDDDNDPNNSKAGKRKDIRKVMSNKKLEDSTRAAAKAEEKRRKRIAAKQREFNIETMTDENNPIKCVVTTKLVLEAGKEEGDKPLVEVNKKLVRKLKPHQVEAVQFLWDCLYESVKRAKKQEGAGCILAHCMGLGKTLSVIAFVHTVLSHKKILKHKTCLVVSPLNTVLNWRNEWSMWLDEEDQFEVWELASCKQNAARVKALRDWQESGGILIIGYEMYRNLTTGSRCKNKKQKAAFIETLVDPGPDLVVCDEGHILKNEASAISKAMNKMRTKRRVVLTGTPLQNNLNEYHCMLSFVKPNLLGTRKEFNNRFISPIQNGQCTDSTPRDVSIMKARAHVLHEMLAGCVQRRDYSALTKFLPPKQEYVICVRLTNIQIELYEKYLELTGQGVDGVFSNKSARMFTDYHNLMKIWTHPWVLKLAEIRDELKARYDDDEEDSFIDDSEDEKSFSSNSSSSDDDKEMSDSGGEGTSGKQKSKKGTRKTRAATRQGAGDDSGPDEVIKEWKTKRSGGKDVDDMDLGIDESDKTVTKDWWAPYVTEDDKAKLELSNKLYLLFEILRMCEEIGDKVLIFSQSILSLNIIESFLEAVDTKFQAECDNMTEEEKDKEGDKEEIFGKSWTKNLDYYRMDGTTSAPNRQMWATSFNDLDNYRARLFLISTRAGGLGINLVAANRVIIFDASWNPSHDVQSIFRVYRFGQTKPCYIYRFLAQGTMEEKIYERQVMKLSLSQRVVDEHQIERHFSANDLKELYNFRPDKWDDGTEKPTLSLPKDPLLAEILTSNKHCVVNFHEHDSLLENQVEQTLTEEEKKAAWDEYENEKKGIIMRGPGMERTASWPMMAAAQILSKEQITITFQALRQQLPPDISEDLFQLHLQQALKRQVQIKQEEMRRMEMLRMQEMNYINMIKQQGSLPRGQTSKQWLQLQQLRAAQQNHMTMGNNQFGMSSSTPMNWAGQGQTPNNPISNKPEEAIDLDDN